MPQPQFAKPSDNRLKTANPPHFIRGCTCLLNKADWVELFIAVSRGRTEAFLRFCRTLCQRKPLTEFRKNGPRAGVCFGGAGYGELGSFTCRGAVAISQPSAYGGRPFSGIGAQRAAFHMRIPFGMRRRRFCFLRGREGNRTFDSVLRCGFAARLRQKLRPQRPGTDGCPSGALCLPAPPRPPSADMAAAPRLTVPGTVFAAFLQPKMQKV